MFRNSLLPWIGIGVFIAGTTSHTYNQYFSDNNLNYFDTPDIKTKIRKNPLANKYEKEYKVFAPQSSLWRIWTNYSFNSLKKTFIDTNAKLKTTVQIQVNNFPIKLKEEIPYSISNEQIASLVQNMPQSTKNTHYWIHTIKNNTKGEIKVQVLARLWYWDWSIADVRSHTELIKEATISGFQKYSDREIIKERSLKIKVNYKNLFRDKKKSKFLKYIDSFLTPNTFGSIGSGFLIGKDPLSPIYYIATNKHVVNSTHETKNLEEDKKIKKHALKEIGIQEDNEKVFVSPIDALSHMGKKENLKDWINFENTNDESLNYKNVKSIELHKDYSNPAEKIIFRNKKRMHHYSLNSQLNELTKTSSNEFITLDMVVFKVEFISEWKDPFKEMWKKRPTKITQLSEQHFFNKYESEYQTRSEGVLNEEFVLGSFSSDDWICSNKKNIHNLIKINKGINTSSPFWEKNKTESDLTQNSYIGTIHFKNIEDLHVFGASGSPVYNQNLEVAGILWSGEIGDNKSECKKKDKVWKNYYSWIQTNIKADLFDNRLQSRGNINESQDQEIINQYKNSPNYSYTHL